MPQLSQVINLFDAISHKNPSQAIVVAEAMCAAEEKRGNHRAARRLRAALEIGRRATCAGHTSTEGSNLTQTAFPMGALAALAPVDGLDKVVLPPKAKEELQRVVAEWKRRHLLLENSIPRRTRLFFHGPPGCGKSMTARAIAYEMELPIFVARFDSIVGAYLGQTAVHLRQLFQFAEATPSVVLLDELDALGKRRGNPLDVGELDRIVISLMQELEHSHPYGLIIATSNLPEHLDRALWRRFDLTLELPSPRRPQLVDYARTQAAAYRIPFSKQLRQRVVAVSSFADAARMVEADARNRLLTST